MAPKKYDLFFRGVSFLKESNDKLPEEIGGIGGGDTNEVSHDQRWNFRDCLVSIGEVMSSGFLHHLEREMASRSNSPKKNTVKMYGNHQPDSSSIFLYDLIRVCRDILNLMGIELTLRSSSTPNEEKKP